MVGRCRRILQKIRQRGSDARKENRTEDADGSNERGDIGELGDSRTDDERERPVHDHRDGKEVFSSLGRQRRRME